MNNKNIITPNSNKKIIVVSCSRYEHLENLLKDCIIKGNSTNCDWFKYYFFDDPCGAKVIYTNYLYQI